MSGRGLKFFDYDNDGNLDLFLCNGNPDDLIQVFRKDMAYQEPMLLFHGNGKSFQNLTAESGPVTWEESQGCKIEPSLRPLATDSFRASSISARHQWACEL